MTARVLGVLPARLDSRRLPGKLLRTVAGRPLLQWSWRAARRVPSFDATLIATDSEEIQRVAEGFGARTMLTSSEHRSGTDRVAEVARSPAARSFEVVVNFQADEPFLPPDAVDRAVAVARRGEAEVATLAAPVRSREEWRSSSVVKVVRARDGRALYFSRAGIPRPRGGAGPFGAPEDLAGEAEFLRHAGLYAFAPGALERWASLPTSGLERVEGLEQLRALEAGMRIHVTLSSGIEPGVDVPDDLPRAERLLRDRIAADRESHV